MLVRWRAFGKVWVREMRFLHFWQPMGGSLWAFKHLRWDYTL